MKGLIGYSALVYLNEKVADLGGGLLVVKERSQRQDKRLALRRGK